MTGSVCKWQNCMGGVIFLSPAQSSPVAPVRILRTGIIIFVLLIGDSCYGDLPRSHVLTSIMVPCLQ